ncbi:MAG: riboflavin biosynthesis protein RibD [Dehalococcoidia bacterium]|nr:riboflavin biosynthesis protein RibD [Dehalococcoidia bacterium]
MQRALALARRAKGRSSPNPAVGAVVVHNGQVVGEGWTQPAGQDHAEVEALHAAGHAARGGALYVTLEPCHLWGRTPPCTDAIRAAGIVDLHVAALDPNPSESGRGVETLRGAGVRVEVGEEQESAREINADYARFVTSHRPWIVAKYAMSLDGKIATRTGDSRYLTGDSALRDVHQLRDEVDAILVGVNTVLQDDPQLTTRLSAREPGREAQHPWRLVLDSHARTPPSSRILGQALPGRTTLCITEAAPAERVAAIRAGGTDPLTLPNSTDGRINLAALADELGNRRIMSLLVEGGATVHGAFMDAGLVDRLTVYVAPVLIGGTDAPAPIGGMGVSRLSDAIRTSAPRIKCLGEDVKLTMDLATVDWPEAASLPFDEKVGSAREARID